MRCLFESGIAESRKLGGFLMGVALFLVLSCARGDAERPPNIVLIVMDTVRADALGGELAGSPVTPHLDRLLAEGTSFSNAFANAPWTVPSHATLFTGLYPHRHGSVHERFALDERLETVAEILSGKGYSTCGITSNPWLRERGGFGQGFEAYEEVYRHLNEAVDKGASLATDKAVEWVSAGAGGDRPFFLFVNYIDAHLPYAPPAAILESMGFDEQKLARSDFSVRQAEEIIGRKGVAGEEEVELARTLYRLEIAYVDRKLGELIRFLEESEVLDETLLVVTADHGEHLAEHGLMGHEFSLYDELLRVPLILRLPGRVRAGLRVEAPVSHVDVLPTILDLLGEHERIQSLPGRSLLDPEGLAPERPLLAEYVRPQRLIHNYWKSKHPEVDLSAFDVGLQSIRRGSRKLIVSGGEKLQLFDVTKDPSEERNLLPEHGQEAALLQREIERLVRMPGADERPAGVTE